MSRGKRELVVDREKTENGNNEVSRDSMVNGFL